MSVKISFVTDFDGKALIKGKLALAAVGTALVKLGKDSVKAALADQKAYAILGNTLKTRGWDGYQAGVKEAISALQMASGIAEDRLIPAFTTLFNTFGDVTLAQKALNTAMDVSAGTGKDLDTVVSAISKAALGSNTALSKLNVGLSKSFLKTASFADIMERLGKYYFKAADTAAETTTMKMERLRLAIGEGQETVGYALLDVFARLAGNGSVTDATRQIDGFSNAVANMTRQIGGVEKPTNWLTAWLHDMGEGYRKSFAQIAGLLSKASKLGFPKPAATIYSSNPNLIGLYKKEKTYEDYMAKLRTEQLKREKQIAAEKAKQVRLSKLAAMFDLQLVGLAAAKARTSDKGTLNRLNALDLIARSQAGLPVSEKALAAAERAMTNITVNVGGSVISERDLDGVIRDALSRSTVGRRGGGVGAAAAL